MTEVKLFHGLHGVHNFEISVRLKDVEDRKGPVVCVPFYRLRPLSAKRISANFALLSLEPISCPLTGTLQHSQASTQAHAQVFTGRQPSRSDCPLEASATQDRLNRQGSLLDLAS